MKKKKISIELNCNTYFKSIHFEGYVKIINVNEEDNDLEVTIKTLTGQHDEHWNLEHTITGFENGDYWTFYYNENKDPNRVHKCYNKYRTDFIAQYNMILQDNITCADCGNDSYCKAVFGGCSENKNCQFHPSKFYHAKAK